MMLMFFCEGEVFSFRFKQQEGILRIIKRFCEDDRKSFLPLPFSPFSGPARAASILFTNHLCYKGSEALSGVSLFP